MFGLFQLQIGTDMTGLTYFFSAVHALMDRYFSQTGLAALGELRIKSQGRTLIRMSCSIRHRSKQPSWAEGNTVQLKKWVKFLQPADLLLQHLR